VVDSLEPLLVLLVDALSNRPTRERSVRQFQALYWDRQMPKTAAKADSQWKEIEEVLGDLAYDLDFFEPDPKRREPDLYGHERLEKEINAALQKLARLGIVIPQSP
jgi:hypothetical protein